MRSAVRRWATPITLLVLLALLMGLAAVNKLRLVPRLSAGDPRAAMALRFSIICEIALILLIFATTAVLTGLFSPPGEGVATGG